MQPMADSRPSASIAVGFTHASKSLWYCIPKPTEPTFTATETRIRKITAAGEQRVGAED